MIVADHIKYEIYFGWAMEIIDRLLPELKKSESMMLTICNLTVLKKCFNNLYYLYPKIETLPEEEKKQLWEYVKEKYPNKTRPELIEACKIIYTYSKMI